MLKNKRSAKTPVVTQGHPVVEDKKPSSSTKRSSTEIDDIFAGKKRKKREGKKSEIPNKDDTSEPKSVKSKKEKKKRKIDKEDVFSESSHQPRKKTADGFTIYTEDELGINKSDAGNTPLCPFDCSCCF